jgi:hypothetical protein
MSDPASDVNEAVCWQCGAPADPDCAFTQALTAWPSELKDGQGYPVVRGQGKDFQGKDYVRVRIPRCEACRDRNWILSFLVITCCLFGSVLGMGYWSSGWGAIGGAVAGLVPPVLGIHFYQRLSGRRWRSNNDYPPLQRLRQAGWIDPN